MESTRLPHMMDNIINVHLISVPRDMSLSMKHILG